MEKHESNYRSYLLRLWRDKKTDTLWRVMLQDIETGEQRHFSDLDNAFRFLAKVTNDSDEAK